MLTFDDFDAWGAVINGAHLRLACDSVERPCWTLGLLDLDGVVLQMASEGGGNICYGGNTHTGPILFVPLTHAREHVVNGLPLDDDSLLAIPRGADFSIRVVRKAHAWCSIALPQDCRIAGLSGSARITCRKGSVRALRQLVNAVAKHLIDRRPGSPAHQAAGHEIAAAAISCLTRPIPTSPAIGRPRLDRATIVRRAMDVIEASAGAPAASAIARRIGINERTLLRTFQEMFGVSPKKYLMLRELHVVRRLLSTPATADTTVAEVLAHRGIWEFGRFAGRYRNHFGECPSKTLQRARS